MDERTLQHGDLQIGRRFAGGILNATIDGQPCLIKDAANRKHGSLRTSIPNGTDIKREYATYLFAKMVPGLVEVPTMALRRVNGADLLVMELVTNGRHNLDWDDGLPRNLSVTIKRNMALFDAIVGNTDRHGQNYFLYRDSERKQRIIGIDHGLCFPIPSDCYIDVGSSTFLRNEALPQWCLRWLNKIMGMETKIRRALAPLLEPEAVDHMFLRVQWMIKRNRFMDRHTLTTVRYA